jgi:hypothetical protein
VGCLHPDELKERLTSRQWAGWLAYLKHFPLPHDRADINSALHRADTINSNGGKAKAAKLLVPYGRVRQRRTEAELKGLVAAHIAAKAHKGK